MASPSNGCSPTVVYIVAVSSDLHDAFRTDAPTHRPVLDGSSEPAFERLTRIAARVLGADCAQLALIDGPRESILAQYGSALHDNEHHHAFCRHVVKSKAFFEVSGTYDTPRAANSPPTYADNNSRFYAGAPVTLGEDVIGVLCVGGPSPRALTASERATLEDLAATASAQINLQQESTALKEAHRFLLAGLNANPTGILIVDTKGRIQFASASLGRLFGYSPHEIEGEPIERLVPDSVKREHVSHRARFIQNPTMRPMGANRNLFGVRKDGTLMPIEVGLNPFQSPDGLKIVASIIDITDRHALEALKTYASELEVKNAELDQVAFLASHDLKAPLRTIANAAALLVEEGGDRLAPAEMHALQLQQKAIIRMDRLIQHLLDHGRLGQDRDRETVDCAALINEVIVDLSAAIADAQAEIEVGPMPAIRARQTELRIVFQNLLGNAIKFRRPNVAPRISLTAEQTEETWLFCVRDNGIGIAPDHFGRIFQLFQRLHGRDQYEGLGVGLGHCKKIVATHNGKIWVTSTLNEGSTFSFTIGKAES